MRIRPIFEAYWERAEKGFQLFSICRQGVSFLIGVILAKSVLSLTDIGTYEIWLFLGLILSILGLSGLFQSFLASFPGRTVAAQKTAIFSVFILTVSLTSLLAGAIFIGREFFLEHVLNIDDIPELWLVLVYLVLHLTAALIPYLFLVKKASRYFVPYCVFYVLGSVLSVAIPLMLVGDLSSLLRGLVIWAIIEQLVLLTFVFKWSDLRVSRSFLKLVFVASIPLGAYAAAGLLAQVFDAWLVNLEYSSLASFAIFKYGARELPGALALAGAFTAAMIVFVAEGSESALIRISKGSHRFMHFFFPVSIVLMLFSESLFGLLYSSEFKESAMIFDTYLLIMISRWLFPQAILISQNRNRAILIISAMELLLNIMLSVFLVRYLGMVGIALGTVLAFWFEKLVMVLLLHRSGVPAQSYIPVKTWIFYSVAMLGCYIYTWKTLFN